MMNNDYQEAIRTLNTLLRFDEDAFEGYFLRGIAKYNLDDLLGAEDDFSTACRISAKRSNCAPTCPAPITAAA